MKIDHRKTYKKPLLKKIGETKLGRQLRYIIYCLGIYDNSSRTIIFLHNYKAIYVCNPKVASSSLKLACLQLLGMNIPKYYVHEDHIFKKENAIAIYEDKIFDKYPNYWKFCFVRNPWDRVLSCYSEKIKKSNDFNNYWFFNGVHAGLIKYGVFRANMSFEEFVRAIANIPDADADPHFRSQHTFITNKEGEVIVDYIGKFESLNEDFSYVCNKLGIDGITLPHIMTSPHQNYRESYNQNLRNIVRTRFSKDIEMFGYEF